MNWKRDVVDDQNGSDTGSRALENIGLSSTHVQVQNLPRDFRFFFCESKIPALNSAIRRKKMAVIFLCAGAHSEPPIRPDYQYSRRLSGSMHEARGERPFQLLNRELRCSFMLYANPNSPDHHAPRVQTTWGWLADWLWGDRQPASQAPSAPPQPVPSIQANHVTLLAPRAACADIKTPGTSVLRNPSLFLRLSLSMERLPASHTRMTEKG